MTEDWTHGGKPGNNACPDCCHGLGTGDPCQWCGWPDKEGARADTAYHLRKLERYGDSRIGEKEESHD